MQYELVYYGKMDFTATEMLTVKELLDIFEILGKIKKQEAKKKGLDFNALLEGVEE